MAPDWLQNPQLDGGPFLLPGGPLGVLLMHGFTAATTEVELLAHYLHERGCTVLAPLLPGHNATPADLNRTRWQDWAAEVERAYRQLAARCDQVVVGGESAGALLALNLAADHPEIAAVLAYAPALQSTPWKAQLMVALAAPFVPYRWKKPAVPSVADERWKGYRVFPLRASLQLFALQRRVRRRLSLIRRPILILQGRLDAAIDPDCANLLARSVSSSIKELHYLDHSPHVLLIAEEWELAASLTHNFLQKVLS